MLVIVAIVAVPFGENVGVLESRICNGRDKAVLKLTIQAHSAQMKVNILQQIKKESRNGARDQHVPLPGYRTGDALADEIDAGVVCETASRAEVRRHHCTRILQQRTVK